MRPRVDLRRHVNRAVAADAHYRSWFEQRFVEDGIGHVPQDAGQAAQRYEHVRGALYAVLGHRVPWRRRPPVPDEHPPQGSALYAVLGSPVIAGGGCQASARYPRQGSAP